MEKNAETTKQNLIIKELSEKYKDTEKSFCIITFGCQMNARDSEKLAGILSAIGFKETDSEDADIVIFNTCTVRENADMRLYGRLGQLKKSKEKDPSKIIGLCGCMMQEQAAVEKIRKSYNYVDIIFGTNNIFKFPELLRTCLETGEQVIDIWDESDIIVEDLPVERKYFFKTGINIMFGCNNFCSYCIVPYVRGRERSRKPEDIIDEIKKVVDQGVLEVMLLGQNVNSYGKTLEEKISFAELLSQVAEISGLKRVRFMTSHPKDLSTDLMDVCASYDNICDHFHLPLQSGSNKVLKDMNRGYTREEYLEKLYMLKEKNPDMSVTTDIIVGFPTETEKDFLDTLDVAEKALFDSAYTFIYSKRRNTKAALMENLSTDEEIKERFDQLLQKVSAIGAEVTARHLGRTMPVLIEGKDEKDPSMVTGRLSCNTVVHLPGDRSLIGKIKDVKLTECKGFYYMGILA